MTTALQISAEIQSRLQKAGIVFLSKSLEPQSLDQHRAKVGLELEIVNRKVDRFGWDSMNDHVSDRLVDDCINALAGFTIKEITTSTKALLTTEPKKAVNEELIRAKFVRDHGRRLNAIPKPEPAPPVRDPEMKARGDALVPDFLKGKVVAPLDTKKRNDE